jgi:hypothetical protein
MTEDPPHARGLFCFLMHKTKKPIDMKKFNIPLVVAGIFLLAACGDRVQENQTTTSDSDTIQYQTNSITYSEEPPAACDDSRRYESGREGGGIGLKRDDALTAIQRFRERNPEMTTGFHISKKALDSLFTTNMDANGIWIDLVNPSEITELNSKDLLGVIVTAKNNPHFELKFLSGADAFISVNKCPTMCDR